jgi:hypothetical protein
MSMLGKNTVVEYDYDANNDNTGATFYLYETEADATLHDKATGLIDTLTMTATYQDGRPQVMKVVE